MEKGGDLTDDLIQNLKDAGCVETVIAEVRILYENGRIQDAVKRLRRYRCTLMDTMHKSQEHVDCLDYLVRRMEKEERQNSYK